MYFTALFFGWLADFTANKKLLTIINIRRTANTVGQLSLRLKSAALKMVAHGDSFRLIMCSLLFNGDMNGACAYRTHEA